MDRSRLGDIPTAMIEKRSLFRSVKDEYYKTIGPLVLGSAMNAYGKVALKRFINNIPMICIEIMQDFP